MKTVLVCCFSGKFETATSFGQGMQPLSERIARDCPGSIVRRFGYWEIEQAKSFVERTEALDEVYRLVAIGHSFGGDAALELVNWFDDLDEEAFLYAVDPVPRSAARRYFRGDLPVGEKVIAAICERRSQWTWLPPWSKWLAVPGRKSPASDNRIVNRTIDGDHNSIMRSTATQGRIVDFVSAAARYVAGEN